MSDSFDSFIAGITAITVGVIVIGSTILFGPVGFVISAIVAIPCALVLAFGIAILQVMLICFLDFMGISIKQERIQE